MLAEETGGKQDRNSVPISAIFAMEEIVPAGRRTAIIGRVLSEFTGLPAGAKSALRNAVNQEITPASGGFRKGQAGRALDQSSFLVQEPINRAVLLSDDLAGAVLHCWAESHTQLQEAVERHLTGRGLSTPRPDLGDKLFRGHWLNDQWEAELESFVQTYDDDFDRADVSLMLCYVTGNLPSGVNEGTPDDETVSLSDVLSAGLSRLRELPATSPEWKRQIPEFVTSLSRLIDDKAAQLRWTEEFDAIVETLRTEYGALLSFFEEDASDWAAAKASADADTSGALDLVAKLREELAEYMPLHERAASISEERERTAKRDELQPSIVARLARIAALMSPNHDDRSDQPAEVDSFHPSDAPAPVEHPPAVGPASVSVAAAPESIDPGPLPDAPMKNGNLAGGAISAQATIVTAEAPSQPKAEIEALESENSNLRDNTFALRSENQDLKDEVEVLKTELFSSQASEESWRLAYRSVMDGSMEEVGVESPVVESVLDAVDMARNRFRQELVFAPNADSSIEDNPFTDPSKVWEALKWLATTYYSSKMGRLRVTDFDQSIKEACGWWYKGDQGETTVSRYRDSYTTRVNGKRYTLVEHIGKGTTFDARYTIRIAFQWDRDRRQVVVGYIGRHQQTDAS